MAVAEVYYRLQISEVPAELEDELASFCFSWQASGVCQNLAFEQTDFEYQPTVVAQNIICLEVYFAQDPGEEFFAQLAAQFPALTWQWRLEQQKDWLAEWKKSYQPFCLIDQTWIVPSWCEVPPQARRSISIDPGMAFGTGTHATTRLASRCLAKAAAPLAQERVLDVGTGTGILAILAHQLGARAITVTDIDPEALRVAEENFARNGCANIEIFTQAQSALAGPFELIMANIVDGVLLKLKEDFRRWLAPHGRLILSGILLERDPQFAEQFFADFSFANAIRLVEDEWVGYDLSGWTPH